MKHVNPFVKFSFDLTIRRLSTCVVSDSVRWSIYGSLHNPVSDILRSSVRRSIEDNIK